MILHHSSAGRSDRIGSFRIDELCAVLRADVRSLQRVDTSRASKGHTGCDAVASCANASSRAASTASPGSRRAAARRPPDCDPFAVREFARGTCICPRGYELLDGVCVGTLRLVHFAHFTLLHFTSRPLHSTPPDEMTLVTLRRLRRVEKICIRMCTCARD